MEASARKSGCSLALLLFFHLLHLNDRFELLVQTRQLALDPVDQCESVADNRLRNRLESRPRARAVRQALRDDAECHPVYRPLDRERPASFDALAREERAPAARQYEVRQHAKRENVRLLAVRLAKEELGGREDGRHRIGPEDCVKARNLCVLAAVDKDALVAQVEVRHARLVGLLHRVRDFVDERDEEDTL